MISKLIFCILISLISTSQGRVDTTDFGGENLSNFDDNLAEFNYGIYKHILKEYYNETIGFSPISIQYLLSIAFMGTTDSTYERLARTLRLGAWTDLEIAENFRQFLNISSEDDDSTILEISNKIYIPTNEEIMSEFKEIMENYFNCEIENVDFEDENVAETANKFRDLIPRESINNDTRLILVNSVNFNGKWDKQFPKGLPFIIRRANDMEFLHLKDINCKIYKLNFIDTTLSLLLIIPEEELPKEKLPKEELPKEKLPKEDISDDNKLSDINPFDVLKNIQVTEETILYHPFKLETTINLKDILKKMKLEEIYSDSATFDIFSNSPEPLKMSDIYLKVSIDFNSEGMDASASTWSLFSSTEIDGPQHTTTVLPVKPEKSAFFALMSKSSIIFAGKL